MKLTNLINLSCAFSSSSSSPSSSSSSFSLAAVAMFLWPLISGLLFSNAQYSAPLSAATSSNICDSSKLLRCQQEIVRDVQAASLNAASVQYPLSGPPYSPASKQREQQQSPGSTSAATCRFIRSNLDCLLQTTPACFENGLSIAQSSNEIILRAKRFLEQNSCNEPDPNWQSTYCFRSTEVNACEDRYGFSVYSPTMTTSGTTNATACFAYQAFKYCIDTHLRLKCKISEIDMANEYLIDRAGDLAWRCPTINQTSSATLLHYNNNPYALNNQFSADRLLSPSSLGGGGGYGSSGYGGGSKIYEQRPIPTYVGSQTGRLYGINSHEQSWERFKNPIDETQYGISRFPNSVGAGEVFGKF